MYNKPARIVSIPEKIKSSFSADVKSNTLSTKALALKYGVHRATVDRWKQTLAWESFQRSQESYEDAQVRTVTLEDKNVNIQPAKALEISVVVNDLHVPYIDLDAWDAVLAAIDYYDVDKVFLNGDILDFPQISRFDNNPERMSKIQDDIDMAKDVVLGALWSRGVEVTWLDGNHEFRRSKYLMQHPEIHSLRNLRMPALLDLDKNKTAYLPYGSILQFASRFVIHHGEFVRQDPGNTAKVESMKHGCSGITGHVHRLAQYKRTTGFGGTITWTENGHLSDPSKIDYTMGTPNWQQGFSLLLQKPGDEEVYTETIPVNNGQIITAGFQYLG